MSGFRIRGVFGMEYPRVGAGTGTSTRIHSGAGARKSVNIANNQMYLYIQSILYTQDHCNQVI